MDLATLVRRAASEHGREMAVVSGNDSRTYGELDRRARRLANGLLATGLRPGDRVGVLAENSILYPEVDIALVYAGLVRVALNTRLGLPEFSYVLDDAGARALVTDALFDETAAVLAESIDLVWLRQGANAPTGATDLEGVIDKGSETQPDAVHHAEDPAWISYTSGTTGRPKGVVLSRRALVQVAFNLLMELGPPVPGRSVLLPQQFSHGAGFFLWPYLAAGGTVHIQRKWDPEEALDIGRRHRIGTLKLVPAMLADLIQTPGPSAFDTIIYGAAPLPAAHLEAATDRFGEVFIQIYGQTEAPATLAVLHKSDHARPGPHRQSAGRAWRTVDLAVLDPAGHPVAPGEIGEIVARGTQFMTEYHRLPEETTETLRDGQLWTRDMGIMDEEGFVYLRGRRDDAINSGGFNIAPKEVEEIVEAHPGVDECVAVGVPDERLGQAVRVYITLAGPASVEEEDLIEFCKPRLGFRRPRSVVIVGEIPRNTYGKVDRGRQTPEAIARAAADEDCAVICLSILSGAHVSICRRLADVLARHGMAGLPVVVGGIIPDEDVPVLKSYGVRAVFGPGSRLADINATVRAMATSSEEATA